MSWSTVRLGDLMPKRIPSVDPSKYPDEVFELWSIPAFDAGTPEVVAGSEIGSSKKCVEPNDVLLSRIVPHIRRSWIVGPLNGHRQIASGEWITFRSERTHPAYLRHLLISDFFHAQFMQTVAGVGGSLLRARPEGVKQIEIPLPPLTEQQRIAAILDAADALRAKRRAALAKLDTLAQSIFIEMFGDPLTNEAGFEVVQLGELCDVRDGTHDSPKYVDDGFPLLTSKNFSSGEINFEGAKRISAKDYEAINRRSKVDVGDIVMPMIGTIGSPVIIREEPNFAIKNVALIKFVGDDVTQEFVKELLSGPLLDRVVNRSGRGGTQKFVALGDLRSMEVPLPQVEQQRKFSDRIEKIQQLRLSMTRSATALDDMFTSLQHRAFRGELTSVDEKVVAA